MAQWSAFHNRTKATKTTLILMTAKRKKKDKTGTCDDSLYVTTDCNHPGAEISSWRESCPILVQYDFSCLTVPLVFAGLLVRKSADVFKHRTQTLLTQSHAVVMDALCGLTVLLKYARTAQKTDGMF